MTNEHKLEKIALKAKSNGNSEYLAVNYKGDKESLSLLAILYYDLKQGGFPQYIYNSQGIYIAETLELLKSIGATIISKHLNNVVEYCLEHENEYQEFFDSYMEETSFKNKLLLYSINYSKENKKLIDEISGYVNKKINS